MQPFVADITMYQSIWPLAMCLNRPHPTTHYPSGYLAGYVCVCPKRTVQPRFGLTVCRLSELGAICTAACAQLANHQKCSATVTTPGEGHTCNLGPQTRFLLAEGVTPCADHRKLVSIVLLSCSDLRRDNSRMNVARKLVHVQIYPRQTLYIGQYWAYSVMC